MLGRSLLFCAIGFSAYAAVAAPASTRRRTTDGGTRELVVVNHELLASARRAVVAAAVATLGSALVLWYALATRDFTYEYVWQSVTRSMEPWYLVSAMWSGMSGSLLLWSAVLAVFAALFAGPRRPLTEAFVPWAIPVLSLSLVFFLAITAWPENPFRTLDVVPVEGRGMNPLLFSYGMLIHPPLLYTGLVGLLVPFAVAVSAMVLGRTGPDWIRVVRMWTLVPWLSLGLGLVIGGAWAYTELGWGGYWGWDPVENAALLPWLAATAFLHSAVVQERRGMLKIWNLILVMLAADLAVFGTFLTRSGLISSVHSFAESPIGIWFFGFLGLQTILGLALLAWRLPALRTENRLDSPVSKEAGFLVNNLVFLGAAAVVLWGTVLPLVTEAVTGRQYAVGPPFFNRAFSPLGALLLLLAAVAPVLPWRRGSVRGVAARLALPALCATVAALGALAGTFRPSFAGLVWIAVFLASVSLLEIWRAARARGRTTGTSTVAAIPGLFPRNPRRYGGYLVHLGIAVMVIGFAGSLFRVQSEFTASPGESFAFAGYTITYRELARERTPDRDINMAVLTAERDGRTVGTLRPQLNVHRGWDQPRSKIAVRTTPASDLYVILAGTRAGSDEAAFIVHRNPLVFWVWAGTALSVLGGLVALLAGRRRTTQPHEPASRKQEAPAWNP